MKSSVGFEQSDTCYDIIWVVFKPDIENNCEVKAERGGPGGGQCTTPDMCRMCIMGEFAYR